MKGNAGPETMEPSSLRRLLESDRPQIWVELRPPRADLGQAASMDAWIDLHHALGRLIRDGRHVFLTDSAVGQAEEENLAHLMANLPEELPRDRLVPILTCKHTLEYCTLYAQRAQAAGLQALTVVGGDRGVGTPRCVPHAYLLREHLKAKVPGLDLGGWANPHRPAEEQAGFLTADDFGGDFYLTQIISHHDAHGLDALTAELERRGSRLKAVAGVFHYRSANPETLARLDRYFPVPTEEITREFDAGTSPEEITARSIRAAFDAGARAVYLSNLGLRSARGRLGRILDHL